MRLAPLLTGTSAGSLGPGDLEEIGVTVVGIDVLELMAGPGLELVESVGGLRAFTGWPGPMVAVARAADDRPPESGWLARRLPQLFTTRAGEVRLRSAVDGRVVPMDLDALFGWATAMGADAVLQKKTLGSDPVWVEVDGTPRLGPVIVSTIAQDAAASGRYWDGEGWRAVGKGADGPLAPGCGCRTCRVATPVYLAHLWEAREITAQHLLNWHNLDRVRDLVQVAGALSSPG